MKKLDLLKTPLSGVNFIEAGAGTGKTYTIAGLFLRLILEKELAVEQILVVTYTRAATEELKDRIRTRLLETKKAFIKGETDDVLIKYFLEKYDKNPHFIEQIKDSLADFDRAAIFTIHGFCQRILQENSFETGSLFNIELIQDQQRLIQEVAEDFWRKYIIDQPNEFIAYLQTKIADPNGFAKLFKNIKSLETRIIPVIEKPEMPSIISFRRLLDELKKLWPAERANISNLLNSDNLNAKIYGSFKPDKKIPNKTIREVRVSGLLKMMDAFTYSSSPGIPLFEKFKNFTAGKIEDATKKNRTVPTHYLFELCEKIAFKSDDLQKEMADFLLYLKLKWLKYAKKEIDIKKLKQNEQFFDDLLQKVRGILENKNGARFITQIRKKYHAALVDEFQDTDFIQYDIFKTLFKSQNQTLFLIGDPKQAIYGFRGADLFSYFKAAGIADRNLTLSTNWRSEPELIDAVNTIFSNHHTPFIFEAVCFENAIPGKSASKKPKPETTNIYESPLKLWYLMPQIGLDNNNKINKDAAIQRITTATANEILRLLSPAANSEAKQVQPEDIAVLVRTNLQARGVKTALQEIAIAAVIYSSGNVFSTSQASELAGFLACLLEPANEGKLKSALTGDMLGINANNLEPEADCYIDLDKWFADFTRYANMWQAHGFYRMFRLFLVEHSVKARVLSLPDGERGLTNFLHLAELIHQKSVEKHLGPVGLLKWLNQQIEQPALNEIEQLRLESDAGAVKIITMHKSKGLEFQIVFCPFCWGGSTVNNKAAFFHDPKADFQLTLDIGHKIQPKHLIYARNEILAENLRLLYVALTRARQKCYLVWGRISVGATSALAYLFHYHHLALSEAGPDAENADQQKDIAGNLEKIMKGLDNDQFIADLKKLVNRSHGTIELLPLPTMQSAELKIPQSSLPVMKCRDFSSYIDKSRLISSYSSLIQTAAPNDDRSVELQDHDLGQIDLPELSGLNSVADFKSASILKTGQDIFEFPRGALAGIFFHDILEHLDFQGDIISDQRELVIEKLQFYGFDLAWQDVILNMLNQIISVSLGKSNQVEFSLSDLAKNDRANEMEFYFPVKKVSPFQLKRVFEKFGKGDIADKFPLQLEKLFFSLNKGFLKGYIDLVFQYDHKFYVVDWKSNYLGSHLDYYHKNKLFEIMNTDYYILQYHLYALALHQYLKGKFQDYKYEKGFGGIFYMFLRGISQKSGPDFGIFHDLPSLELINGLGRCLIPGYDKN